MQFQHFFRRCFFLFHCVFVFGLCSGQVSNQIGLPPSSSGTTNRVIRPYSASELIPVAWNGQECYASPYRFDPGHIESNPRWKARWIWVDPAVFPGFQHTRTAWINSGTSRPSAYRALFRKEIHLDSLPAHPVLFLTGDVRFFIYVNGKPVGSGPDNTGGDYGDTIKPKYWYYSSVDLTHLLVRGLNTLAVEVFSWGLEYDEVTSSYGRFIAELKSGPETLLTTDSTWKAIVDSSYKEQGYFLQFDARTEMPRWRDNGFRDTSWPAARVVAEGQETHLYVSKIPRKISWAIHPSRLIQENKRPFLDHAVTGGPFVLDYQRNRSAYINLKVLAQAGDSIDLSPFEKWDPRVIPDRHYLYICKAGLNSWTTPNISPFRYLSVSVKSRNPVVFHTLDALFSSYPVQQRGSFLCSNPFYNKLWSIARYTTQLCMSDLFFDSPMHQEPIGCTGDYFIESMNGYYAFGDHWLARQNLVQTAQMMEKNDFRMFHTSYSLLWVQMLRQYVRFTGDSSIIPELLPVADRLIERFRGYQDHNSLVSEAPNYMFMDWITIKGFNAHHPPAMIGTGYLSALLYKAMKDIDELRLMTDQPENKPRYRLGADSIKHAMNLILWDSARQQYRDGIPFMTQVRPNEWLPADSNIVTHSAHVNTLAVLYDIAPADRRHQILQYVVSQTEYELQPYFMSYVLAAAEHLSWKDSALALIDRWRNGIDTTTHTLKENWQTTTTSGYKGDYSHAWGGSPLRWLSANVLGVTPDSTGFNPVAIRPYIGKALRWAKGTIPVGDRDSVGVYWEKSKTGYRFRYSIPKGRTGKFFIPDTLSAARWQLNGRRYDGLNPIRLPAGKSLITVDYDRSYEIRSNSLSGNVLPTKEQAAWADAEMGVIIHLDINIFAPETFDYARRETLPELTRFTPSQLNTDQWIRTAKAAGARYAVLTVKHGTGFCLWPSKANDYNVGHTDWGKGRRDILKSFLSSCRKFGIKPGLYYNTNSNSFYGAGYTSLSDSARAAYRTVVLAQLRELWTDYGKLFEIWFDGGLAKDGPNGIESEVIAMIRQFQPQAILFQGPVRCPNIIRWVGNENGTAADPQWSRTNETTGSDGITSVPALQGNPSGSLWCPAESDFPIRQNSAWNGGWLWKAGEDSALFSAKELITKYQETVGRNTNMLLGMVVDTSGKIPVADSLVLDSLGHDIKKLYSNPLSLIKNIRKNVIEVRLPKAKFVHRMRLSEDISKGERIRAFTLDAWVHNKWTSVASGQSVGHCRLQKVAAVTSDRFRLRIQRSDGSIYLNELVLY